MAVIFPRQMAQTGVEMGKHQRFVMTSLSTRGFSAKILSLTFAGALFAWVAAGHSTAAAADANTNTNSSPTATTAGSNEEADKAWKDLQRATRPPMTPSEWQGHPT